MSRYIEEVMGTVVSIEVPAGTDPRLVSVTTRWLHRVEHLFSVFLPDSEISRIGRGELAVDDADPDVRHVLTRCDELELLTRGAFCHRSRVADRPLDPSGYVKGWSVERALLDLRMAGLDRACIGAGGDIAGFVADGDEPWKIGIRNPDDPRGVAAILDLADGAVATSGEYERGRHIQRQGARRAAPGMDVGGPDAALSHLTSVSVVGPDLGTCDALATAIWAAVPVGIAVPAGGADLAMPDWLVAFPDHDVLVCTSDGRVRYSERIASLVQAG